MTSKVYLGIGSNSGDRRHFIGSAIAALAERLPIESIRTSDCYESAPDGFDSPNHFVNIAAVLSFQRNSPWTDDEADALFDAIEAIQNSISTMPHRNPDGSYRDREIDIDILLIDNQTINTARLTIPHPRMFDRPFVTIPLSQINQ